MGYYLFYINSPFYQDICTPFSSPEGTDVLLLDRINDYYYNNETLCQSNCKFSDYLFEPQYLKCICNTSNSEIDTKQIKKFNPKVLYESFYDTLKFSNYKVLSCYKLAFHINSITINIGSILVIIYFFIFISFSILYYYKGIRDLKLDKNKEIIKMQKLNHLDKKNDIPIENNNKKEDNNINNKDIDGQNKSSKNDKKPILNNCNISPKKIKLRSFKNITFKIRKIKQNPEASSAKFSGKDLLITNKILSISKNSEFKTEKKI